MFIGHFAVALAGKKAAPKTSLGASIAAVLLPDLLWPLFLLLGWEEVKVHQGDTAFTPLEFVSYPYSHSLLADVGWGLVFAGTYYLLRRDARGALWLWAAVQSHWLLDFITHRADMPLTWLAGSPRLGLGLWNSVPATLAVEVTMFVGALWLYAHATRARGRAGSFGLWGYVAFLAVSYLGAWLGPPPPTTAALVIGGLVGIVLFPLGGWWIDRSRDYISVES